MSGSLKSADLDPIGELPADIWRARTGRSMAGVDSLTGIPMVGTLADGQVWVLDPVTGNLIPGYIEDLGTAETDATLVLAPDGSGGVEFRAETGGISAEGVATTYLRRLGGEWGVVQVVAASGAALTLDLSLANTFDITVNANCALTLTNPPANAVEGKWTITLRQGGTGSYTVTWPAAVKWRASNGTATTTAPTLATAVGAVDVVVLTTLDGGTTYGAALDNGTTAASPLTTKGDLYGRTSSADARLGVGTDGTFVMADSTATTGLSYALPRPLMVADTDGTHWNVVVDGDGNAVMVY